MHRCPSFWCIELQPQTDSHPTSSQRTSTLLGTLDHNTSESRRLLHGYAQAQLQVPKEYRRRHCRSPRPRNHPESPPTTGSTTSKIYASPFSRPQPNTLGVCLKAPSSPQAPPLILPSSYFWTPTFVPLRVYEFGKKELGFGPDAAASAVHPLPLSPCRSLHTHHPATSTIIPSYPTWLASCWYITTALLTSSSGLPAVLPAPALLICLFALSLSIDMTSEENGEQ
ncbi:hypothetical protein R3P38DRAFT_3263164 [Favolaschia claudopus]|uniref:Uncharacterized protein n=1 Tax=Favolaschia claudopus TaxID=2862362 RepID=A0AAW0CAV7_9AGAR